ncbi:MAG: hypothetical protein GY861_11930 [bacterium]|nr:hypothetical protein [bacterium]
MNLTERGKEGDFHGEKRSPIEEKEEKKGKESKERGITLEMIEEDSEETTKKSTSGKNRPLFQNPLYKEFEFLAVKNIMEQPWDMLVSTMVSNCL